MDILFKATLFERLPSWLSLDNENIVIGFPDVFLEKTKHKMNNEKGENQNVCEPAVVKHIRLEKA